MPEVSICIPTFNGARYLRDCLDSAVTQSFADLEIVVVDDGSTDASIAIVEEYAASDPRIVLFRNEKRLGLVGNWNRAVSVSSSPWVKFLFQDDMLTPDCVGHLYNHAKQTASLFVACYRHFLFEDESRTSLKAWYQAHQQFVAASFENPLLDRVGVAQRCLDHFAQNFVGEPTVTLLHRDLFEQYGTFNPALAHRCDAEYWFRIGTNVGISMVRRFLAVFRVHGQSATTDNLSNRQYANEVLDPLVVLYLFLNDPAYDTIRTVAEQRDVLHQMVQSLRDLSTAARQDAYDSRQGLKSAIWNEWCRVTAIYPALAVGDRH